MEKDIFDFNNTETITNHSNNEVATNLISLKQILTDPNLLGASKSVLATLV